MTMLSAKTFDGLMLAVHAARLRAKAEEPGAFEGPLEVSHGRFLSDVVRLNDSVTRHEHEIAVRDHLIQVAASALNWLEGWGQEPYGGWANLDFYPVIEIDVLERREQP